MSDDVLALYGAIEGAIRAAGDTNARDALEALYRTIARRFLAIRGVPFSPERAEAVADAIRQGLDVWHWSYEAGHHAA